jgi:hypothetical protein
MATSNSCPKRRAAIEEAKAKKEAAKKLIESRKRIQVIIPKRKPEIEVPETPRDTAKTQVQDTAMTDSSQTEALLQAQLC